MRVSALDLNHGQNRGLRLLKYTLADWLFCKILNEYLAVNNTRLAQHLKKTPPTHAAADRDRIERRVFAAGTVDHN